MGITHSAGLAASPFTSHRVGSACRPSSKPRFRSMAPADSRGIVQVEILDLPVIPSVEWAMAWVLRTMIGGIGSETARFGPSNRQPEISSCIPRWTICESALPVNCRFPSSSACQTGSSWWSNRSSDQPLARTNPGIHILNPMPAQTVRGVPRSMDPPWLRVTISSFERFSPRRISERPEPSGMRA